MKLDVFDTYVTQSSGTTMHFDVLLPQGSALQTAKQYALAWLSSQNIDVGEITLNNCRFCHTGEATPDTQQAVTQNGYAILQMEGCPSPIV